MRLFTCKCLTYLVIAVGAPLPQTQTSHPKCTSQAPTLQASQARPKTPPPAMIPRTRVPTERVAPSRRTRRQRLAMVPRRLPPSLPSLPPAILVVSQSTISASSPVHLSPYGTFCALLRSSMRPDGLIARRPRPPRRRSSAVRIPLCRNRSHFLLPIATFSLRPSPSRLNRQVSDSAMRVGPCRAPLPPLFPERPSRTRRAPAPCALLDLLLDLQASSTA